MKGRRQRGRRRPLRIATLIHGVGGTESGVRRLILDQAAAWRRLAPEAEIGLFVRCEAGTEDAWRSEPGVVAVRSSGLGIIGRFLVRELLSLQLALWRPDVLYLRHSTISPSVLMLAALVPTIVGGDLDDLDELRIRSRLRYWYARVTRHRLLRLARRIIVVTHEIARHASFAAAGRPVTVLPNSIDLAQYPELPAPSNERPRLVFIGAPHLAWAGVDKIVRLATYFPEWDFDVIGSDANELGDSPGNLVAHGPMTRERYLPIMRRADVAIGPLALHRKGLSEASALKVAEYLAYGIPVILGCDEAAFPGGAPFLLRLPNDEGSIDASVDDIRAFVEAILGTRVERSAIAALDTMTVEAARLELLRAEVG